MSAEEICFLPAVELRAAYGDGRLSPVDAVDAVLDRIDRRNGEVNAFVTLCAEQARAQAREAEAALRSGAPVGPLHGIPVLIKDLTPTAGIRTTFGSIDHAENVPDEDALAWQRIRDAGAILIGKTTTPDYGTLGVTESTMTGTTTNPWDASRTSGGSSGGSAAGVVSGFGHLSWGSDGGGSIRIPSAFCGAVGLKASIGRIPGHGEQFPFETVGVSGPITRTVADTALLLAVTAGPDLRDPISLPESEVDWLALTRSPSIDSLRIGYCEDLAATRVSRDVAARFQEALGVLRELGATVEPVELDLPDPLEYFMSWWGPEYLSVADELAPALAERSQLIRRAAEAGRGQTPQDRYRVDTVLRPQIARAFAHVFAEHDALVTPTLPVTAFPNAGTDGGPREIDGVAIEEPWFHFTRMTEPPSHVGLPAITVPCGTDPAGLPVGLQIIGPYHDDAITLRVGAAFEAATEWTSRHPA